MREMATLLNEMRASGVITNYAVFGAMAQMRYTQPVATLDADVLVAVPSAERLDVLGPIYEFCRARGYKPEDESVRVGAWPVQFIPFFNDLTHAAMEEAETVDFEGVPLRVVRADYLAVVALSAGRPKDFTRILALMEAGSVSPADIGQLAGKHGLAKAWNQFKQRFLNG